MKRTLEHWLNKPRDYQQEIRFGDTLGWIFTGLIILGAYLWFR